MSGKRFYTEKVTVRLHPKAIALLEKMHASGMWGTRFTDVVREVIHRTLREEDVKERVYQQWLKAGRPRVGTR